MEVIESSPIQNCSGMESDRGDVSDSMCKNQGKKKIKRLRREVTENPESKLEGVRQNVDMIAQPFIQDNPNTELDTTATVELRRRKRRTKRKLLSEDTENPERKMEVNCENVDIITQPSIQGSPNTDLGTTETVQQDNPNTDLGTTATVQQDNTNTELGTTATVQPRKHKRRTKRKLLSEDTENPERKMEVNCENVDIITQPSIQGSPNTDLGTTETVQQDNPNTDLGTTATVQQDNTNTELGTTATVQPRKHKRRTKRKLLSEDTENPERKMEVNCENVDIITQPSIQGSPNTDLGTTETVQQDNPNTDLGTTATVQQDNTNTELGTTATVQPRKHKRRTKRKLLSEDTENPERKMEVNCENVDIITQPSIQGSPNTDLGTTETVQQDNPNTDLGTTATVQQDNTNTELGTTATVQPRKHKRRTKRKLLSEDTENPERKMEVSRQDIDIIITQPSIQDNPNSDPGTTSTIQLSKRQIRKNRELLREETENPETKLEVPFQNVDVITQLEMASGTIATPDAEMVSKGEEHMEVANGLMESDMPKNVNFEGTIQKKKKKKSRKEKAILGELLNSRESEDMEVAIGEAGSGAIATPDAEMVSKGEEHMEVANGQIGSDMPKNVHIEEVTTEKKKKKKSRKEKRTLGEILNSGQLEDMEVAIGETVSGSIATPDAEMVSKGEEHMEVANGVTQSDMPKNVHIEEATTQKKKKKSRKEKPVLGEILNSQQLEDVEVAIGEAASVSIATPDAEMVSKGEEHTEVANGLMGSEMPKNVHIEEGITQKKKKKSRKEKPVLGEVLNSQQLEDVEVAIGEAASVSIATPDAEMVSKGEEHTEVANGLMGSEMPKIVHVEGTIQKKKKKQSRKEKLILGEISNSRQLEDMEVAIGETASGTIATPDAEMVSKGEEHTEVANALMESDMPKNVHIEEGTTQKKKKKKSRKEKPILVEISNSQQLEDMEVAIGETASGSIATPDAEMVSKGEEHTEVANGLIGSDMPKNAHTEEGTTQKKKKKKSRKEKPVLGEILNSQQLEDVEVAIGEVASVSIATPDAEMVSKGEEHTEVANDLMESDMPKNVNIEGTIQKKKKKSRKEKPVLGENLNSRQSEDMEVTIGETSSGTTATDNIASEKRKRKKLENKDPASCDILGTRESEAKRKRHKKKAAKGEVLTTIENPQDSIIAKKDEDTNKVLEATSTESKRENNMEIVSKVEEEHTGSSGTTITKIVSEECTEVGNNETEKKEGVGLKAIDVIPQFPTSTKKLLVFDVNGLLADIVQPPPKDAKADMYIMKRAIFKRPFLEDFLYFCFDRFHIGIWSSRRVETLKPMVDFLLGDLKNKLLFLWDAGRCTRSRMNALEVRHKKIVFKDLRKIWEKDGPRNSWQKGTFNQSNTLLLDDSPYKALLNPKHSGIFPVSYSYKNKDDDFLGPNGSLRTYLDGLAATDDLKTYVEQNPFGQRFIDEKTLQWTYYSRAINSRYG